MGLGLSFINCEIKCNESEYNNITAGGVQYLPSVEGFSVTNDTPTKVTLNWTAYTGIDTEGGELGYLDIEYWKTNNSSISSSTSVDLKDTLVDILSLMADTNYTYNIRAVRENWDAEYTITSYSYSLWTTTTKTTLSI